MKNQYKYIYGPVFSWRLGMSLGIDPVSQGDKICNFDCIYCQLGNTTRYQNVRQIFVSVEEIVSELNSFPYDKVDYFTFSARGEPTLAKNLGEMIRAVKQDKERKVAVITNAVLIDQRDVQDDLMEADIVLTKLDFYHTPSLHDINNPEVNMDSSRIIDGIKSFRKRYKGKLALQIMFMKENENFAKEIASIAKDIQPDEVQINTPLRPCGVQPLNKEGIDAIKEYFSGLPIFSVYDVEKKKVAPLSEDKTKDRHGDFLKK